MIANQLYLLVVYIVSVHPRATNLSLVNSKAQIWVESWRRVLIFFVRTQVCRLVARKRGTTSASPRDSDTDARIWAYIRRQAFDIGQGSGYQFTVQQQLTWNILWQAATDRLINPNGDDEASSTFRVDRLQLAYMHSCTELLSAKLLGKSNKSDSSSY